MEEEKCMYISGQNVDFSEREKCLGEYFFNTLRMQKMDNLFQVVLDKNEKMTFGELFQLSAQICQGLIQHGMEQGDVITLVGANSNAIHASLLGIIWAGGVPHPVGSDLRLAEMDGLLRQVKPKWIFCETRETEMISSCLKNIHHSAKIVLLDSPTSPSKDHLRLDDILVEIDLNTFTPQKVDKIDNLVIILDSSGTTGIPKGIGLTHSILNSIYAWEYVDEVNMKKPYLLTSTFSWMSGVYFMFLSLIHGNFRAITTSNKPSVILKAIQDYKLYGAMIPPSVLQSVLDSHDLRNYDTSSLKEVWTGGSMLAQHTIEKFQEEWPDKVLTQSYGITEAGGMVTKPIDTRYYKSVGRLLANTDAKIVDPDTNQCLGPNEYGEICVRSKTLLKTYVGNEEAVNTAVKNGWLHTGDIGYYSEDGHLYITSRTKELIKIDNMQISPTELENYILSLPGVLDVGVSGIYNGEYCTALMALVKKSPDSTIIAEYITRKVEESFGKHKHLGAGAHFVDSLPRNVSGKLQRSHLRQMADAFYKNNKA